MKILETKQLKKYYGSGDTLVKALDGINLSVCGAGRICIHCGNIRQREINASAYAWRVGSSYIRCGKSRRT